MAYDPLTILLTIFAGVVTLSVLAVAVVFIAVGRRVIGLLTMRNTVIATLLGAGLTLFVTPRLRQELFQNLRRSWGEAKREARGRIDEFSREEPEEGRFRGEEYPGDLEEKQSESDRW